MIISKRLVGLLVSVAASHLIANEYASAPLLNSITKSIEHIDKVATETNENESYQPYIISI